MITLHDDIQQGTPEWLAARADKYTGSNAYKLLTSFGAGDHAKNGDNDFKGNFYTKRGHMLEDEALELYEQICSEKVLHTGFVTNSKYPNALYSPDGFTDTRLLEVKCFSAVPHMAIYELTDITLIPLKILAQVHFGMMIMEKPAARLIIYNPQLDARQAFKFFDINHDQRITNRFNKVFLKG